MEIKIIPITQWTGKKNQFPRRSQFKATYSDTLKLLKFELEKAGIHGDAQLQMFISPADMRQDGNLRANARPFAPGVKIVFRRLGERFFDKREQKWKAPIKTVSYPCDAFDWWQDNLRGIALSMAAFRQIERYGVFKYQDLMDRLALPEAGGKFSDADAAAEFIARHSSFSTTEILRNRDTLVRAYKAAALTLHPDQGGSQEDFIRLQEANRLLSNHHG